MKQQILAISGKKKSGKDTLGNFFKRNSIELLGVGSDEVKFYYFAEPLKELCIEILGLPREKVWGTDEDKNELTDYVWEDMPTYSLIYDESLEKARTESYDAPIERFHELVDKYCPTGKMTIREVMQYIGTDIFRKMNARVWSQACLRKILKEKIPFPVILDMRFSSEVEEVHKNNGKVIRLTRQATEIDLHSSETALDDYKEFDFVLDNQNLNLGETYKEFAKVIKGEYNGR